MVTRALAAAAVLALSLGGCARVGGWLGSPIPTTVPSEAVTAFPGRAVAVCTARGPEREEVIAVAEAQCPQPDATARYWGQDWFLNDCPLLKNRRAVYICEPQG